MKLRRTILSILFSLPILTSAQELTLIKKWKDYEKTVRKDSGQRMVELRSVIPGIVYDLRYARVDNFTGQVLYSSGTHTFLRLPALMALKSVSEELKANGFGLKVFDAYRPYAVTVKMWELIRDERYVANPAKGSGHNRGLAIDLTLIDAKSGKEEDMGTSFDHFSDTAHHAFQQLPQAILNRRLLLKKVMEKHGFRALDTEWWHYSWPNDRNYAVLDLSFRQLLRSR